MTLAETSNIYVWKRKKLVAILLAAFLGAWTWIYTYNRDAWKATFGLGFYSFSIFLVLVPCLSNLYDEGYFLPQGEDAFLLFFVFYLFIFPIGLAIWLWAVIDTIVKKSEWYNIQDKPKRSKLATILFAIFLSFWTWFYTYTKDKWKFWIGFVLNFSPFVVLSILYKFSDTDITIVVFIWVVILFAIWIYAIVDTVQIKSE
jgi:uncharacterized membrane protein